MDNRPKGREKNVTGAGKGVNKRGSGLGTGPVGSTGSHGSSQSSRPGTPGQSSQSSGQRTTRSAGKNPLLILIAAVIIALGGGGLGLGGLLGGGETTTTTPASSYTQTTPSVSSQTSTQPSVSLNTNTATSSAASSSAYSSLLNSISSGNVSTGWNSGKNTGTLDTSVAAGSRDKRTKIVGGGQDTVTIMVYMCGTDLESKSGMGTADLQEMAAANLSDKVNLLVYTGGCKQWRNSVVSSSVNQIYRVKNGGLQCLVPDAGSPAMTKPATLTEFIKFCADNFKADRYELIFWDHGGGSLTGYGYDEKNATSGSMTLKGINEALANAGVSFDFIGFDACLMATLENALMLEPYGDYLIASEETEPGVGWYYTNWLTALSKNTSMTTLEIGRNIVDDFVSVCNQKCSGQKTTLSVIDLAELNATVPEKLKDFASDTAELLQNDQYQTVSNARSSAREFAASSKIDQVDLVDLANGIGTEESKALAKALMGAVKYNKTSSNMTNAYGLSIYFPYKKLSSVDSAVAAYSAIGMDDEYAQCIKQFASIQASGQAASGGASSPLPSLFGGSSYTASSSAMGSAEISSLLNALLGGGMGNVAGLSGRNSAFLTESGLDADQTAAYISANQFDAGQLVWTEVDGVTQMTLSEQQWSLVHDLELNVFFDDGEGYIDLGLDNVFDFTEDGALLGEYDGTWLAIDQQPVAYYYENTVYDGDDYTITGRVPVMLNGDRAELILVFDTADPYGYIAGAVTDYRNGETETVAKSMTELTEGDTLEFLCDYYGYDGSYQDSYYLGDPMTYHEGMQISNVYIDAAAAQATYLFTDIYCQEYWTPIIP